MTVKIATRPEPPRSVLWKYLDVAHERCETEERRAPTMKIVVAGFEPSCPAANAATRLVEPKIKEPDPRSNIAGAPLFVFALAAM